MLGPSSSLLQLCLYGGLILTPRFIMAAEPSGPVSHSRACFELIGSLAKTGPLNDRQRYDLNGVVSDLQIEYRISQKDLAQKAIEALEHQSPLKDSSMAESASLLGYLASNRDVPVEVARQSVKSLLGLLADRAQPQNSETREHAVRALNEIASRRSKEMGSYINAEILKQWNEISGHMDVEEGRILIPLLTDFAQKEANPAKSQALADRLFSYRVSSVAEKMAKLQIAEVRAKAVGEGAQRAAKMDRQDYSDYASVFDEAIGRLQNGKSSESFLRAYQDILFEHRYLESEDPITLKQFENGDSAVVKRIDELTEHASAALMLKSKARNEQELFSALKLAREAYLALEQNKVAIESFVQKVLEGPIDAARGPTLKNLASARDTLASAQRGWSSEILIYGDMKDPAETIRKFKAMAAIKKAGRLIEEIPFEIKMKLGELRLGNGDVNAPFIQLASGFWPGEAERELATMPTDEVWGLLRQMSSLEFDERVKTSSAQRANDYIRDIRESIERMQAGKGDGHQIGTGPSPIRDDDVAILKTRYMMSQRMKVYYQQLDMIQNEIRKIERGNRETYEASVFADAEPSALKAQLKRLDGEIDLAKDSLMMAHLFSGVTTFYDFVARDRMIRSVWPEIWRGQYPSGLRLDQAQTLGAHTSNDDFERLLRIAVNPK